jgi:hypothetical protein
MGVFILTTCNLYPYSLYVPTNSTLCHANLHIHQDLLIERGLQGVCTVKPPQHGKTPKCFMAILTIECRTLNGELVVRMELDSPNGIWSGLYGVACTRSRQCVDKCGINQFWHLSSPLLSSELISQVRGRKWPFTNCFATLA